MELLDVILILIWLIALIGIVENAEVLGDWIDRKLKGLFKPINGTNKGDM